MMRNPLIPEGRGFFAVPPPIDIINPVRTNSLLLAFFFLSACTLRIASYTRLTSEPGPTAIPLPSIEDEIQRQVINPPEKPISLPPGFGISVYADELDDPRMIELGPDGHLYVAERGAGRILRFPDRNGDGLLDRVEVAASGLIRPSSLDFYQDGSLFVGETRRIVRLSDPDGDGVYQEVEEVIAGLPAGGHSTRTVLFSPDFQSLFVSIGSSCNVCLEEDERRAAIVRYNPDGSDPKIFARGLRNAVGITFRPGTGELWATNNGRDFLGDDLPPDAVYMIEEGKDYGWPRCHVGRIIDPEFGAPGVCENVPPALVEIQAHSAPLGLEFYGGDRFPREYQGDLFVALHGSWNRSVPVGYKVIRIPISADGVPGPAEDFAVGWLIGGSAWGRPVDLASGVDGSLYLSDDAGGKIYRIFFNGQ